MSKVYYYSPEMEWHVVAWEGVAWCPCGRYCWRGVVVRDMKRAWKGVVVVAEKQQQSAVLIVVVVDEQPKMFQSSLHFPITRWARDFLVLGWRLSAEMRTSNDVANGMAMASQPENSNETLHTRPARVQSSQNEGFQQNSGFTARLKVLK